MLRPVTQRLIPRFSRGVSQALQDATAWNQAPTQITTLANGVRVATKESFGELGGVGVFIDAGVRSQTADAAGAAHLVEQLAFTGTAKRSQSALDKEVESMGATLDVNVGREQSAYTMSCFRSDIKQSVDILGDIVTNTPAGNLDKHRESILRKLAESDQPTQAVIDDRLHLCAYRDCSLGLSAIGPHEGIESLSSAHVSSYVNANYTANNTVLVATGAVNHGEIVKMAEASLGGLKAGQLAAGADKPYFCGAELIYRNDEMGPTAYISMGYESVPAVSADAVTFMVMQHVIGSYKKDTGLVPGNISGNRTINAVANKMSVGCADEFHGFNHFYKDTGVFGFYAACDEVAVEHCIGEMQFAINLLAFSVTEEEVARGKRELKHALFGGSGSAADTCGEVGKQILTFGREIPAAEMILRIDAIDAEEVKRVAWQYTNDTDIAVTALGPLHGMPTYMELRRGTGMHRY